jgi:hypothetical protein
VSDITPPTVVATTPASGATGVSRSANLNATFSEAMNAASINSTSFQLRGPGGTLIPAVVSYSGTNLRATLNPNPTLATLTSYTAVVRGGAGTQSVKDAAGNPLAVDRSWTFTTR